ncbi:MAG: 2-amino-4-hydroxy-6-hydroxymethyldihydropteridine diphosphokinase, partial [Candidatus Eremiobacteraeota bacterium]|nr:2-amino-4-hydroxy-6-hydroxymethyldihydropteridine diphosphokinase [Candidatus Eremiobacteraeota bacterium]
EALSEVGTLLASSSLYRTKAWGPVPQADYVNAAAVIETQLTPRELLRSLKGIEKRLGRVPSIRWGPRSIDLDILTYEDAFIDEENLQIPHPRLQERAFVLAPLGEILEKYAGMYASLPGAEQATVLEVLPRRRGETIAPMITERVRQVAEAFEQTDLVRLRIQAENDDSIELRRRRPVAGTASGSAQAANAESSAALPVVYDAITSDLVGIVHFSKPVPAEGEMLKGDRELAYVEALGIRNPVRSLRGGRLVSILVADGDAVEYGQRLFEIDRV